jgi:hypothetical protein
MEDDILIKKKAKKAAFIVGWATLIGFSFLLFMPSIYMNPFTGWFIAGYILVFPLGLLGAYILGLITYNIFKRFIKNRLQYRSILCILIIISLAVGFMLQVSMMYLLTRTPPYKNEIDTNHDGKIDNWIYHDGVSSIVEIDTDYDGKPDIRKYYDNGELVKTEKITDLNKNAQKK